MDALQGLRFFMYMYFKVIQTEASSWIIDVPSSVKGLPGSCVVIPCSFNYPDPQGKAKSFTGIWRTTKGNQVIYHRAESKILEQHQSRTKFLGDISEKNCSLMVDNLQQNDRGPFYFRIEIGGYDSASYKNNKVSILMISEPNPTDFSVQEEVKEGQAVSASCSVSHSCPTYPPTFRWSHSGEQRFQAQQLQNGQWKATSTLTFHPKHTDHNKPLQCRVTYHGGKHQETSKTLKIKYAPVNVKVEHKSDVNEGETVHLKCSSDANPVSSYEWHRETGALLYKGQTYTMSNVSRHSVEALYCIAINEEGRARSSPVHLSVLYAPDIKTSSKCSSEGGIVKCECIVESKPPSMVHFVLADRVLQSSKVEIHGSDTTGTLLTEFVSFKFVHCLANNTLGNANLTLSLPVNDNMHIIFITCGASVILLIILTAIGVGVVQIWKENNEDAHFSNIYTNDHVYGNINCHDSIYANE